jgi:hypothetical protein
MVATCKAATVYTRQWSEAIKVDACDGIVTGDMVCAETTLYTEEAGVVYPIPRRMLRAVIFCSSTGKAKTPYISYQFQLSRTDFPPK